MESRLFFPSWEGTDSGTFSEGIRGGFNGLQETHPEFIR